MTRERSHGESEMEPAQDPYLGKKVSPLPLCQILITCTESLETGAMDVKMTYEGDPVLASMLLDRAKVYMDQDC